MSAVSRLPASLAISLIVHLLIFSSLSVLGVLPSRQAFNDLEVTYYRVKSKSVSIKKKVPKEVSRDVLDTITPGQRIILSRENKIPERNIPAPETRKKDEFLQSGNFLQKPSLPSSIDFLAKNTVALSPLEVESADKSSQDPAYLEYGNYARERIRRCLYSRFSNSSDTGIVCIRFTISADGALLEYSIVGEKTNAGDALKQIAIAGLKDAAPFPPFPKELNSKTISYAVFIQFKNNKNGQ